MRSGSSRKSTKKTAKRTTKVARGKAFSSYARAIKYLYTHTNYETEKKVRYNTTTFDLKRMDKLLSLVANPHRKIDTVHIAGTKGKGSTATMLAKMLEYNGYKVGLYTSPHLVHSHG